MKLLAFIAAGTCAAWLSLNALAAENATVPLTPARASAQAAEFFESQVRPVLAEHCFSCHGPKRRQAGLRLDGPSHLLAGSDNGPVIKEGKPERSVLIQAIRYQDEPKMPPKGKLPAKAIDALTQWVNMGAPWPQDPGAIAGAIPDAVADSWSKHWAFQPVRKPALPTTQNKDWARTAVDLFILARFEEKGMTPSQPADRRTLLRRVTLDLTGLPPTPAEIDAFLADPSPQAYEKVVERLLASPHYGERWGRHWLDVARYADTKGYVFQEERRYPYAYTYRDYVIRAFNEDLPYDQFIVHQLAADRLPLGEDKRPLAAMGFLTLGRRFLNNIPDIIDDRIDVMSRGLLGLTLTCARCHDHKFDPIPTKDYYSLYGVFASSTEPRDLPLLEMPERSEAYLAFEKELKAREQKFLEYLESKLAERLSEFRARTADYLVAALQAERMRGRDGAQALNPGDLSFRMVRRWQSYLDEHRKPNHPVFGPWNAYAELPSKDFAARAVEATARLSVHEKSINPLVYVAFAGKPPSSLQEVARRYGELFARIDQQWQEAVRSIGKPEGQGVGGAGGALTRMPNEAAEELRQVLYGPGSPFSVPPEEATRLLDRAAREKATALRRQADQWKATSPSAPPRAMVLQDAARPQTPRVFVRGNPNNPGDTVPRQFLEVLAGKDRKPFTDGSGRLELARAIATDKNPLTARVLVNRVWLHHFGAGLVRTPSDFGMRSDPPTHPELLDYLAARFMEEGWSLKQLHRWILLSSTYQQSSADHPRHRQLDPENRLLWRMNRQRLDFEGLRDALLAVSGDLELRMGGKAVDLATAPFTSRRTVYGFIDRQNLPGLFRTFDFASPDATSPQRYATTVPQQALYLMNSPFVVKQARHLVSLPDFTDLEDPERRIQYLYRRAYGRAAEPEEVVLGLRFVSNGRAGWEAYAQVILLANEFVFLD